MTLLTIARAVADEVGIDRPSSVIGNPQPEVQKLLRHANKVGNRLMKSVAWQVLRKEKTYTSVSGETQTSILPSDFDRFVPETFWDRSASRLLVGPIGSVEWQGLKAGNYSGTPRKFIYRGGDVLVIPSYSAGSSLAFEYISKNWCQSSGATAQTAWAADTDTGILDEELLTLGTKLVYLTDEGQPNGAASQDFDTYFDILIGNDQPTAGIMVAGDIFNQGDGFGGSRHFSGAPSATGSALLLA